MASGSIRNTAAEHRLAVIASTLAQEWAALYTPNMAIIEKHAPGSFCWVELATSDQAAAKDFYSKLFDWTPNDFPMGPGDFYTIFRLEGRDTAAAATMRPEPK